MFSLKHVRNSARHSRTNESAISFYFFSFLRINKIGSKIVPRKVITTSRIFFSALEEHFQRKWKYITTLLRFLHLFRLHIVYHPTFMLFAAKSHRTDIGPDNNKKKKERPGNEIDKHSLPRFIFGDTRGVNTASYLQNPSCTSSIDTTATGSDIPEFLIVHMQSGENVSL